MAMAGDENEGSANATTSNADDEARLRKEIDSSNKGFKAIDKAVNRTVRSADWWACLEMVRWGIPVLILVQASLCVQRSETYATDQGTKFWGNLTCAVFGGGAICASLVYVFHREQGQPKFLNFLIYAVSLFIAGVIISSICYSAGLWDNTSQATERWDEWFVEISKRFLVNLGYILIVVSLHFMVLFVGAFVCPHSFKSDAGLLFLKVVAFFVGFAITIPFQVAEVQAMEDLLPSLAFYGTLVVTWVVFPLWVLTEAADYWGVEVQSWGEDKQQERLAKTAKMSSEKKSERAESEDSSKRTMHGPLKVLSKPNVESA